MENGELLKEELSDPDCKDWGCPQCNRRQYKCHGLECDECGFDAYSYVREFKGDVE